MKNFKEKLKAFFIVSVILFAFSSSVYTLSIILKSFFNSNSDYIGISFFICIFIAGIIVNFKEKDKTNESK